MTPLSVYRPGDVFTEGNTRKRGKKWVLDRHFRPYPGAA